MKTALIVPILVGVAMGLPTGDTTSTVSIPVPAPSAECPDAVAVPEPFHSDQPLVQVSAVPEHPEAEDLPEEVPSEVQEVPIPDLPSPSTLPGEVDIQPDMHKLACTYSVVAKFCGYFSLCSQEAVVRSPFGGCENYCWCDAKDNEGSDASQSPPADESLPVPNIQTPEPHPEPEPVPEQEPSAPVNPALLPAETVQEPGLPISVSMKPVPVESESIDIPPPQVTEPVSSVQPEATQAITSEEPIPPMDSASLHLTESVSAGIQPSQTSSAVTDTQNVAKPGYAMPPNPYTAPADPIGGPGALIHHRPNSMATVVTASSSEGNFTFPWIPPTRTEDISLSKATKIPSNAGYELQCDGGEEHEDRCGVTCDDNLERPMIIFPECQGCRCIHGETGIELPPCGHPNIPCEPKATMDSSS